MAEIVEFPQAARQAGAPTQWTARNAGVGAAATATARAAGGSLRRGRPP